MDLEVIHSAAARFTRNLPASFGRFEAVLLSVVYLGLDALAMSSVSGDPIVPEADRTEFIEWIYSHQIQPPLLGGFRAGPCHYVPHQGLEETNLAMTFSALASLLLLGDDLSRVDVERTLAAIQRLQLPSGAFQQHLHESEDDVRFSYCASAVTKMLGSTGGIDIDRAVDYVLSCQTYEGGFAHQPGDEAHGGGTFCALASLSIWGAMDRIRDRRSLALWLSGRQTDPDSQFSGRASKDPCSCYSFWIGASMKMLGIYDLLVDKQRFHELMVAYYTHAGFIGKPFDEPDMVHTHFALAGLSLAGYPGLHEIDPALGFVKKNLPERMLTQLNTIAT
jgi:geranylgeranyl transferase type-1 subunit beta